MFPLNQFTFCRLCLCTSTSLMDIFDERNIEGLIVKETIEDLLQIKVVRVHGCPWLTCDSCRDKLNDFRRFKINCMESKVAFESRFPQQVVLMPGCVGISASAAGTNKPQTILLMPVSSVPAFSTGGFPVGCSQGAAAADGSNQLIWSGGGIVIPGNASVGALSEVSQVITSSGQVGPPPLSNISAPKCNQFIVGGGSGNFLLPTNVHPCPPLGVSQTNASNFGMGLAIPPLANLSIRNGGPATLSVGETTPCPASTQPSSLQPSEEISSANDVLLQPKEEPVEEEEKPNAMDNESLWDDFVPRSPVHEDEIEETDEKNHLTNSITMKLAVATTQRTWRHRKDNTVDTLRHLFSNPDEDTVVYLGVLSASLKRIPDHQASREKGVPDDFYLTMPTTWSQINVLNNNNTLFTR